MRISSIRGDGETRHHETICGNCGHDLHNYDIMAPRCYARLADGTTCGCQSPRVVNVYRKEEFEEVADQLDQILSM